MKHIESIQPEYAAEELERIFREEGDATATAALTRLLHDWTGCDIPQTDTTPQSDVDELVPLAVSILRRHWTTPLTALGDGTTPMSLADLMRRLIGDRVQGNEVMCIPPVHDNIPAAVSALRERKISGVPELPDGVSLPRIFCDSTIPPITELIDDNIGWVMTKALPDFPNLEKLELRCEIANDFIVRGSNTLTEVHLPNLRIVENSKGVVSNCPNVEVLDLPKLETLVCSQPAYSWDDVILGKIKGQREMIFPKLKSAYSSSNCYTIFNFTECEILRFPELEYIPYIGNASWIDGMDNLKELHMPKFKKVQSKAGWPTLVGSTMANLHTIVLGKIEDNLRQRNSDVSMIVGGPNLIHIEVGEGVSVSFNLNQWQPTNVISNPEFLSNFRLYIADRLSDNGSGKTLTLSQEVRDAIHSAGIDTIITNKGWTISPVPTQQ